MTSIILEEKLEEEFMFCHRRKKDPFKNGYSTTCTNVGNMINESLTMTYFAGHFYETKYYLYDVFK